jgi:hypothetical protein
MAIYNYNMNMNHNRMAYIDGFAMAKAFFTEILIFHWSKFWSK